MWAQIFGLSRPQHARREAQAQPLSPEELLQQAPTVRELLQSYGATPDKEFNDFQAYIAEAEDRLQTVLIHHSDVPPVGNVHIALGKVVSRKEVDDTFRDDSKWRAPKVAP